MIISYLVIGFSRELARQTIGNYNTPDLFHLIGFALAGIRLQIKNLSNAVAKKDVVAALYALPEAKSLEQLHQAGKRDICVGVSAEDLQKQFVQARHGEDGGSSVAQARDRRQAFSFADPRRPDFCAVRRKLKAWLFSCVHTPRATSTNSTPLTISASRAASPTPNECSHIFCACRRATASWPQMARKPTQRLLRSLLPKKMRR